jgi:hypothetical protein
MPTEDELNVLYENRNKGKLKGTFNETGSTPAGRYWSSSQFPNLYTRSKRFSDGTQNNLFQRRGQRRFVSALCKVS